MINTNSRIDNLKLVSNWISNSGIQNKEGGFHAWHDIDSNKYAFLYSEITGYGITSLLLINKLYNQPECVEKAMLAAEWIEKTALHPCGGIKTRLFQDDAKSDKMYCFIEENIFSFDTAMVLFGLLSLYKTTNDAKILKTCKKIGDFLIKKMLNNDGSIAPIYSPRSDKKLEPMDKWSNQSGSFHAKISMSFSELFEITGNIEYKNTAIKLCETALDKQDFSGRFITDRVSNTTHLHPHSYTIEGLTYTGSVFNIDSFIRAAEKATLWMLEKIQDGVLRELYNPKTDKFNDFIRTDILAQAIRIGILFNRTKEVEILKTALINYQYLEENSLHAGGLLYSKNNLHINSWCSMFALQALALYSNPSLIHKNKKIELLI